MKHRRTPAEIEGRAAARSAVMRAAALGRHERARLRALVATAEAGPAGLAPMAGAPDEVLRGLVSRGYAERRYVLTADGRAHMRDLQGRVT